MDTLFIETIRTIYEKHRNELNIIKNNIAQSDLNTMTDQEIEIGEIMVQTKAAILSDLHKALLEHDSNKVNADTDIFTSVKDAVLNNYVAHLDYLLSIHYNSGQKLEEWQFIDLEECVGIYTETLNIIHKYKFYEKN